MGIARRPVCRAPTPDARAPCRDARSDSAAGAADGLPVIQVKLSPPTQQLPEILGVTAALEGLREKLETERARAMLACCLAAPADTCCARACARRRTSSRNSRARTTRRWPTRAWGSTRWLRGACKSPLMSPPCGTAATSGPVTIRGFLADQRAPQRARAARFLQVKEHQQGEGFSIKASATQALSGPGGRLARALPPSHSLEVNVAEVHTMERRPAT